MLHANSFSGRFSSPLVRSVDLKAVKRRRPKSRNVKLSVLVFAFCLVLGAPASAQSPNAQATTQPATDIQFTSHDVATLLKATQDAETSPNITINLVAKAATEMPAYDPIVHFAGLDTKPVAATIWVSETLDKTPASAQALRAAMELACMSTGFAGPAWKSIYDQVAAMDAALPANSPNPYKYRLGLTQRIQAVIDSYAPH